VLIMLCVHVYAAGSYAVMETYRLSITILDGCNFLVEFDWRLSAKSDLHAHSKFKLMIRYHDILFTADNFSVLPRERRIAEGTCSSYRTMNANQISMHRET